MQSILIAHTVQNYFIFDFSEPEVIIYGINFLSQC